MLKINTQSWTPTTLRAICQPTQLWNPQRDPRDMFTYIDVSAVSRQSLAIREPQRISGKEAPSRARKIIREGDTIFATVRPRLRRVALVGREFDGQIASTAFCVLRPDGDHVNPYFLYYLLLTDVLNEEVAKLESGASYPAVNDKDVLDQSISLPQKSEQEKIAAVLFKVQRAIKIEEKMIANARELKDSAMRRLFAHGLHAESQKETEIGTVPESWAIVRLGDQASVISKGASPKWQGFDYTSHGVLFVRSQNVGEGRMDWSDRTFLPSAWNEKEKRSVLRTGDVLINLVGASIGRAAVGGIEVEGANCNQAVSFVRLKENTLDPLFLVGFLLTGHGQRQIHSQKKDIARANLSLEDVRNLRVPLPSLTEQREISNVVETIGRKIDVHERKLATLHELFKTLLHQLMAREIDVADLDIDVSEVILH